MLSSDMTMAEALRQVAAARPDQEAVVCGETRLTYGQLLQRVIGLAHGLHQLEVYKGDKIALLLPPGVEFVTVFFAAAALGAIVVPLNPLLRERTLGAVLDNAEPAVLIAAAPVAEEMLRRLPALHHVITDFTTTEWNGIPLIRQNDIPPYEEDVSPRDLLALLYTSGTTGAPKGTMHTHRSLIAPVAASIKLRELWIRQPGLKTLGQTVRAVARYRERLLRAAGRPQTFLSTVGWHTITGLEVMLQALLMGDRLVVMPRFHPREALRLVERERVTILVAVPMAFQVMLGLEDFDRYDTSSLLICGTGAAPCPPHLAREIQRRFGCAVHIGFGATETAGGIAATSIADSAARQAETVGRPMPGIEIKIVDEERREVGPGRVGELACRGDNIMLGYYHDTDATAAAIDKDGWYYTGDLALVDEQGYLHIVGRKKDVIIRGGQNIYPAEIETYLVAHPKIREAAVVGVPSAVGEEQAWAFVLLEDGAEMTAREVLEYCRAALEAYKIPGRVSFVSDFPRSETGKPQKFKLREMALHEVRHSEKSCPPSDLF